MFHHEKDELRSRNENKFDLNLNRTEICSRQYFNILYFSVTGGGNRSKGGA